MKHLIAACAMLLAAPALAADYGTVTVLDSATKVTGVLTGTGYKTVRVENGGSADVFCSLDPAVTVYTGNIVAANNGWQSFDPGGGIYCIAASSQSGTDRDHVIIWGSYRG